MNKYREERREQLGIDPGTAHNQLRKLLLFYFVCKAGDNMCFRCQQPILFVEEFSIEHKTPWLHSDKPHELFFDMTNIAFSHIKCNIGAARKPTKIEPPEGFRWCWRCKSMKDLSEFMPAAESKRSDQCKKCHSVTRAEFRERTGKR